MEINPNSSQSTGSSTAPNALGNVQRPGEYLRQVRINQKCDLAEVAKALNIPEKTLTALEQDDYKVLPEATFIKGYYRSYAKFLQVDATNIIQRFDDIYANDTGLLPNHALNNSPIKIMGKLPGSNRERNRKWLKRAGITVAVILILWAAIAALKGRSDQEQKAPAEDAVEVLSMDGSTVAMSGDQLALNFNRPTSVHIVDSTGKVLLTGRQANATTVSGEPPFQIRLDDAAAVSLNLNNENISLTPYTVGGKAEFRLSR
jgi:transcriptional regulator with XRE-family HTH domain